MLIIESCVVFLVALLSGARNEKDSRLAQVVYEQMKKLFPKSTRSMVPASVLLANVYAASGDLEKASDIRRELQRTGMKKKPGLSWTATNRQIYVSMDASSCSSHEANDLFECCRRNSELMVDLILDQQRSMHTSIDYPRSSCSMAITSTPAASHDHSTPMKLSSRFSADTVRSWPSRGTSWRIHRRNGSR